jgi:hypothetical protein
VLENSTHRTRLAYRIMCRNDDSHTGGEDLMKPAIANLVALTFILIMYITCTAALVTATLATASLSSLALICRAR